MDKLTTFQLQGEKLAYINNTRLSLLCIICFRSCIATYPMSYPNVIPPKAAKTDRVHTYQFTLFLNMSYDVFSAYRRLRRSIYVATTDKIATPSRPAQHAKEVWPARFRTRNRNEANTKKMTCRWSRACVRVGSWRRNLYSPPLGIFSQRRRAATTTKQHDDSGVTEGEGLRGDTLRIGCSSGFWGDSATAGDMHDLFYILCLWYPHLLALARGNPFRQYMNNQRTNISLKK